MDDDVKYLIQVVIASLLTLLAIYATPSAIVLEIADNYLSLSPMNHFLFTVFWAFGYMVVVAVTAKPLFSRLLVFYGGDRLKKILEE